MQQLLGNKTFLQKTTAIVSAVSVFALGAIVTQLYSSKLVGDIVTNNTEQALPKISNLLEVTQANTKLDLAIAKLYNTKETDLSSSWENISQELSKIEKHSSLLNTKAHENLTELELSIEQLYASKNLTVKNTQELSLFKAQILSFLEQLNDSSKELMTVSLSGNPVLEYLQHNIDEKNSIVNLITKINTILSTTNSINEFTASLDEFASAEGYYTSKEYYQAMLTQLNRLSELDLQDNVSLSDSVKNLHSNKNCSSLYTGLSLSISDLPKCVDDLNTIVKNTNALQQDLFKQENFKLDLIDSEKLSNEISSLFRLAELSSQINLLKQHLLQLTQIVLLAKEHSSVDYTVLIQNAHNNIKSIQSLLKQEEIKIDNNLSEIILSVETILNEEYSLAVLQKHYDSLKSLEQNYDDVLASSTKFNDYIKDKLPNLLNDSNRINTLVIHNLYYGITTVLSTLLALCALFYLSKGFRGKIKTSNKRIIQLLNLYKKENFAKKGILSTVKRDLQHPTKTIVELAQLLSYTKTTEQQAKVYNYLRTTANSLLKSTDNLLQLDKILKEKLVIRPVNFDPKELVLSSINLYQQDFLQKELVVEHKLDYNLTKQLVGDKDKIQQVLTLMLDNAIKFSEKNKIMITLTSEKSANNKVKLIYRIKDHGAGIQRKYFKKVFAPFNRLQINKSGAGLGLSICRKIVESMHGVLLLGSIEKQGSVFGFSLELPISNLEINTKPNLLTNDFNYLSMQQALKILLIEEEQMQQNILSIGLQCNRHTVVIKTNKDEISNISKAQYDLILINNKQRNLVNFTKLKEVAPVIVISEEVDDKMKAFYMLHGIDNLISQPINWDNLNKVIYNLSKNQRNEKASINTLGLTHSVVQSS